MSEICDSDGRELGLRVDHKNRAVLWVRNGLPGEYLRIGASALADLAEWQ
jgi:hypothetical protein